MNKNKTYLGLLFAIVLAMYMGLGACGAGIIWPDGNGNGNGNGNGGGTTPPALVVTHVENTRATETFAAPEGATSYGVSVDGAAWVAFTPTCVLGTCTYIVPNLNPNELYSVGFRYTTSSATSAVTNATIDTTLQVASFTGGGALGTSLDVGDVNGDGYPDFIVGPQENDITDRRAYLFLGGPGNFPPATGATLTPWATFDAAALTADLNFPVKLGDINNDGIDDALFGEERMDDPNNGSIHILSGNLTSGNYDSKLDADWNVVYLGTHVTRFGHSFDIFDDDGDGVNSLIIGAYWFNARRGQVFQVDGPITGDVVIGAGNVIFTGAGINDQAGIFVGNVGDIDNDGLDEGIFTSMVLILGFPEQHTYRFTDNIGAFFGPITYFNNGSQVGQAYSLIPGWFALSGGLSATGGFANVYDQRTDINAPANQLTNDNRPTFGMGMFVADFYPGNDGVELAVGAVDRVYIYNDFPNISFTADAELSMPGINVEGADFNADGYIDFLVADPTAGGGAGAVYVYY
ncbi:MAG: hypothetical protein ABH871_00090 [Pseudomonadota bacterium]